MPATSSDHGNPDESQEEEVSSDDSSADNGSGLCGAFGGVGKLFWRNPDLAKAILAAGVQQAGAGVTCTFLQAPLMGKLWGKDQAQFTAALGICINILAALTGGAFGRFSDSVDRRVAAAVFGVGQFLPGWIVCAVGMNKSGLLWSTLSKIVGVLGCASNVTFALANDVTDFKDRELAAGVFFAGTNLLVVILNAIPILFSRHTGAVMCYQMALNVAYFACLAWVKLQPGQARAEATDRGNDDYATPVHRRKRDSVKGCFEKTIVDPVRLMFCHRRLRRLCLVAFLLAVTNTLPMVIKTQYFNQALDLYPYGTDEQFARVALMSTLPGQLMVLPGYVLTGFLAKQNGTLKLLRRLIPLTAILTAIGGLMAVVRAMWFVPVVVIAGSYAGLPNVPLMRMVSGVAPPSRMGEALSIAGVSMEVAGLLSNAMIVIVNPWLLKTPIPDVLGVYYPFSAAVALLAIIPLSSVPKGGWGAAAGGTRDAFYAATNAKMAAAHWRRHTTRRTTERMRSERPEALGGDDEVTSAESTSSETDDEESDAEAVKA